MAQPYNAVLLDAFNTLWYPRASISEVWQRILVDLGVDVPTARVVEATEREMPNLVRQIRGLESTRIPNDPSAIENMWRASEGRIAEDLGLEIDRDRLREVADYHFTGRNSALYPETMSVLKELRRRGIHVAMVSNGASQQRTAQVLEIDAYFDHIFGSVHVGFAKPDPRIFHLALSALDIGPEEAIMVGDDWEDDVLGARAVGIRGLHLVRGSEDSPGPDVIDDLSGVLDFLS